VSAGPLIDLSRVSRVHRVGDQEVHALLAVDLAVERGEYLAIMGPSGSGKSTLLNVIGLLDRPSAGEYRLDGIAVAGLDDDQRASLRRDRIGFVFQVFHLISRLSAAENVELPLVLAGVAPGERRQRVQDSLAALGLADRAGHRPEQLSGGQRQRVAIARAMIMQPDLLLADEPTGNLDREAGASVLEILERLNADGLTLLVVTHDPEIGARAARRLRLVDGAIQEDRRQSPAPARA
jgi:putative ABC transport system ATP-binding protein